MYKNCYTIYRNETKKLLVLYNKKFQFAESKGFEPLRGVNLCRVSSAVLSTTQPTLRKSILAYMEIMKIPICCFML